MQEATTNTLDVPGATLYYEVRGSGPLLVMTGGPNDAGAFAALATLLADRHTVITYDLRGYSRSRLKEPAGGPPIDLHADDAARLIADVGRDPVSVFGSSGGAIVGLELARRDPNRVKALVAHEPPLTELLPDAERWRQFRDDLRDTYACAGAGPAFEMFQKGMGFDDDLELEPAQMPVEEQETMARIEGNLPYFLEHGVRIADYAPDIAALRVASVRIVVGGGDSSRDQLPYRTAAALAERIGTPFVHFPGSHMGFATHPGAFAAKLHQELTGDE